MKEVVVVSGKGGTGKTSVTASFAVLAHRAVIADCDVDAPDMHLLFSPRVHERHDFRSGHEAFIRDEKCARCGMCQSHCRFGAVRWSREPGGDIRLSIDPLACEGCGVCVRFCPEQAIDFPERLCGVWMVSETRGGPMVHARLGVGAENSGKLVSMVRREARRVAAETHRSLIVADGPPGIGCPVIASLTGATLVLVVTEPSVSAEHDLERVLALTRHFRIPARICVNKWDLNPEITDRIETKARREGAEIAGRIRYDAAVTRAQTAKRAVVETEAPCVEDIREVIRNVLCAVEACEEDYYMRIAIPLTNGRLSPHFGHCEHFALIDVDSMERRIVKREDIEAPPHEPGLLPPWLAERGANLIIAGGMGQRARGLFADQGIQVLVGVSTDTPEGLVGEYLAGKLQAGSNPCDH
jgi:MinD superfamily P-loop ATPase/predicted Fe-Mo cluster-binding NifX family protein